MGCLGERTEKGEGRGLIDFVVITNFRITKTLLPQKKFHKYTWSYTRYQSIIDYVLVHGKIQNLVRIQILSDANYTHALEDVTLSLNIFSSYQILVTIPAR